MTTTEMNSFEALWAKIGGGSAFPFEEIVAQASAEQLAGYDFFITHRDERYRIPKEAIASYFLAHPRPGSRMSREEEKVALNHRINELENLVANLRQSAVVPAVEVLAFVAAEAPPARDEEPLDMTTSSPSEDSPTQTVAGGVDYKKELEKSLRGKQPLRAK